jgi:hypothetical protein
MYTEQIPTSISYIFPYCSDCTQALLDVLDPEEDLRLYAQIEAGIRDTESKRRGELQEIQGHVKGKWL